MRIKEQVELKNKIMRKINWGDVFQIIAYLGAACVGFGILFWGFTFIWQIIKSIF